MGRTIYHISNEILDNQKENAKKINKFYQRVLILKQECQQKNIDETLCRRLDEFLKPYQMICSYIGNSVDDYLKELIPVPLEEQDNNLIIAIRLIEVIYSNAFMNTYYRSIDAREKHCEFDIFLKDLLYKNIYPKDPEQAGVTYGRLGNLMSPITFISSYKLHGERLLKELAASNDADVISHGSNSLREVAQLLIDLGSAASAYLDALMDFQRRYIEHKKTTNAKDKSNFYPAMQSKLQVFIKKDSDRIAEIKEELKKYPYKIPESLFSELQKLELKHSKESESFSKIQREMTEEQKQLADNIKEQANQLKALEARALNIFIEIHAAANIEAPPYERIMLKPVIETSVQSSSSESFINNDKTKLAKNNSFSKNFKLTRNNAQTADANSNKLETNNNCNNTIKQKSRTSSFSRLFKKVSPNKNVPLEASEKKHWNPARGAIREEDADTIQASFLPSPPANISQLHADDKPTPYEQFSSQDNNKTKVPSGLVAQRIAQYSGLTNEKSAEKNIKSQHRRSKSLPDIVNPSSTLHLKLQKK